MHAAVAGIARAQMTHAQMTHQHVVIRALVVTDPPAARPDGERVKYGVLCLTADPAGVARCAQYGRSYLVLRGCRLRASFADQDTLGTPATLARTGLGRIAALRDRSDVLSHCRSDALSCCRPVRPRVHSTPDWLRGSVPLLFSEAAVRPDPRR